MEGLPHHVDLLRRHRVERPDRRGLVISSREALEASQPGGLDPRPSERRWGKVGAMKIVVGTTDSSVVELQALSGLAPSRSPFGAGTEPVTPQPRKTRCLELEALSLMALGSKWGAKRARCADPVEHGCGARCFAARHRRQTFTRLPVCATHQSDSSGGTDIWRRRSGSGEARSRIDCDWNLILTSGVSLYG
jgi:hypothetical protein